MYVCTKITSPPLSVRLQPMPFLSNEPQLHTGNIIRTSPEKHHGYYYKFYLAKCCNYVLNKMHFRV